MAATKNDSSVFVRGLPYSVAHEELESVFADVGPVRVARIVRDPLTGESRGYGFVRFAVASDVEKAVAQWNGKEYAGRKLTVEKAVWKDKADVGGAAKLKKDKAGRFVAPADGAVAAARRVAAGATGNAGAGAARPGQHDIDVPQEAIPRTVLIWGLPNDADQKKLRVKVRKTALSGALAKRVARAATAADKFTTGMVLQGGLKLLRAPGGGLTPIEDVRLMPRMPYTSTNPSVEPGSSAKKSAPLDVYAVTCTDRRLAERLLEQLDGKACLGCTVTLRRAGAILPMIAAKKRARLIVRNLNWDAGHGDLWEMFSLVGPVAQVHMPAQRGKGENRKTDKERARLEGHKGRHAGYAFVQYYTYKDAATAVKVLNERKVAGRAVAVDWAVPKATLAQETPEGVEGGDAEAEGKAAAASGSGSDSSDSSSDSSGSDSSDSESDGEESVSGAKDSDAAGSGTSDSDSESDSDSDSGSDSEAEDAPQEATEEELQLTVFIRNVAWDTTQGALHTALRKFGPLRYVVLVKDRATGEPQGTAFAAFKFPHSAAASVLAANGGYDPEVQAQQGGVSVTPWSAEAVLATAPEGKLADKLKASIKLALAEGGVTVDGRVLSVLPAVDRNSSALLKKDADKTTSKQFDRRHLYLAKEGRVTGGTEAGAACPKSDMDKRDAAAHDKKVKLASPLFFVSPTKLSFRNVARWVSDAELRKLARQAAVAGLKNGLVARREGDPYLWLPEWRVLGGSGVPRKDALGGMGPGRSQVSVIKTKIFREKTAMVATGGRVKLQANKSKQARAIRTGDMAVQDVQITGQSKGFGFVEFTEHVHALACLRELNNNPDPTYARFAAGGKAATGIPEERRPRLIVDFAVENAAKLKIQENRREAAERKKARITDVYGEEEGGAADGAAASEPKVSSRKARAEAKANAAAEKASLAAKAANAAAAAEGGEEATLAPSRLGAAEGDSDSDDDADLTAPAPAPKVAKKAAPEKKAAKATPAPKAAEAKKAAPAEKKADKKKAKQVAQDDEDSDGDEVLYFGAGGRFEGGKEYADDEVVGGGDDEVQGGDEDAQLESLLAAVRAGNPDGGEGAAGGDAPAAGAGKARGTKRARPAAPAGDAAARPARGKAPRGAEAQASPAKGGKGGRPAKGGKPARAAGKSGEAAAAARGNKFRAIRAAREKGAVSGAKLLKAKSRAKFAARDKLDDIIAKRRK